MIIKSVSKFNNIIKIELVFYLLIYTYILDAAKKLEIYTNANQIK